MKYTIKVVSNEPDKEFDERYGKGIDCDGFVILANEPGNSTCCIHGLNQIDMATMIAASGELRSASTIAKALVEAKAIVNDSRKSAFAKRFFESLIDDDDDDDE